MGTRDDIRFRLGIFAKPMTFDNCGIGPEGFEPGNTCGAGGQGGGGGSSDKKESTGNRVSGIEERARASGKSFTEQWLEETRADINRDYTAEERKRKRAGERKKAKAEEKVQDIKRRLEELKAAGPKESTRSKQLDRSIADIDARLADLRKQREGDAAASTARAEETKRASDEARARKNEEVRKKWTQMFGPKKAEEMLARVASEVARKSSGSDGK